MDKSQEEVYNSFFEVFATKGWKGYIQSKKAAMENLRSLALSGKSEREYYIMVGQATILNQDVHFEKKLRAEYLEYKASEEMEKEDSDNV